jgi:cytochrome c2
VKNALKIFIFTIAVSAFYSYVGQMVPQKETYPPETQELEAGMTTQELVAAGQEIVEGKGTCLTCHTIGTESSTLRFPDLGGIGTRAAARRDGYSDVAYLAESLYEPNAYIVEGFQAGMPAISKPPIGLSDQEILAVIAYLQSLGGTPTVTLQTELAYQGQTPQAPPPALAEAEPPAGSGAVSGEALFAEYLCTTCHSLDAPTPMVGPSLYDVGSRLTKAQIYEAIMEPDATVAEGFAPGIMPVTLKASGFYDTITTNQLRALVDYLASKKGDK